MGEHLRSWKIVSPTDMARWLVVTTEGSRSKSSEPFLYARACEVKKGPHLQRQDRLSGMNEMDWQRCRLEPW